MKNQNVQEEPKTENNNRKQGFGDSPKQIWYKGLI